MVHLAATISDWRRHLERDLQRAPSHIRGCVRVVERFVAEAGISDAASLTTASIAEWCRRFRPKTALNRRGNIGAWSDWLVEQQIIAANPARAVRLPRARPGRGAVPLRPAEMARVLAHLRAQSSTDRRCTVRYRLLVYRLMWETALRASEMWRQEWRDIDLEARTMRVSADKQMRADLLPLTLAACATLRELARWRVDLRVLPRTVSHHIARRDFASAGCDGAGTWHRIRKGSITAMARAGTPLWSLARLSRHRSIATLVDRYILPLRQDLERAQRALKIEPQKMCRRDHGRVDTVPQSTPLDAPRGRDERRESQWSRRESNPRLDVELRRGARETPHASDSPHSIRSARSAGSPADHTSDRSCARGHRTRAHGRTRRRPSG